MEGAPARLEFANGERDKNITVYILNDNVTEPAEQFEIGLTVQNAIQNGGVTIGQPNKAKVTIQANDDANGVIRFSTSSTNRTVFEPEVGVTSVNTATYSVRRDIGTFGVVVVGWRITNVTNTSDISPISGTVTFQPNDREEYFHLSSLADNIPELSKTFVIELSVLSGESMFSSMND